MADSLKSKLEQTPWTSMQSHWSAIASFKPDQKQISCSSTYRSVHGPSGPYSRTQTWKGTYEVDEASSALIVTDVSYEDSKDPSAAKTLSGPFKITIVADPLSLKGKIDDFSFDGLGAGFPGLR